MNTTTKKIAYFSMEFGLDNCIPTFSGGLGVLAGDHIKSAADLGLNMTGIGLLYHEGYFKQNVVHGNQIEEYPRYDPSKHMRLLTERVEVNVFGHPVQVGAWEYIQKGRNGLVPVLFLTTDLPENKGLDRGITSRLYGGDKRMRIAQEIVLGKGGVRMIHKLGLRPDVHHLNEGHGAFATLDLRYLLGNTGKEKTVFTTHTPVPAGHDRFDYGLAQEALTSDLPFDIQDLAGEHELNMTNLSMSLSSYVNAVAKEHCLVSKEMFPNKNIDYITNGVHSFTWTAPKMQKLFDQYIPRWREDPRYLDAAPRLISKDAFLTARDKTRKVFFDYVKSRTGQQLDPAKITIGFARRFAPYKRADLIFHDLERLREVSKGRIQLVFAGKAHPMDEAGKHLFKRINDIALNSKNSFQVVVLPGYDMQVGGLMTSGVDTWLNTSVRPKEASGTSGMKAAHNGVPHLSTIDGWWYEANKGGWSIGPRPTNFTLRDNYSDYDIDSKALYDILANEVIPSLSSPARKTEIGLEAIQNAAYFNTHRMLLEGYIPKAYER